MKRKLMVLVLGSLLALSTVGSVFAAQPHGPNPQPPKCVPANTPGCS
jgi:hypothetical protein